MKATEATANTAGNFIKAKGLDVANKVMGNPAALAGGISAANDFTSSAIVNGLYEPTPAGAIGYAVSEIKNQVPQVVESIKGLANEKN